MNEHQITYRIKQHLNRGLALDPQKLVRLKAMRERALARQRLESPAPALAWADNVVGRMGGPSALVPRMLLPMAFIILGLLAITQWQDSQQAAEIEEIDAAVLTRDLPIDAFLDKGFDAWLRRSSR